MWPRRGSVGLDLSLALRVRIGLTPSGLTKLLTTTRLPLPTGPFKTLPAIPLKVTRTVEAPRFRLSWLEIPVVVTEYLLELAQGIGETLVHDAERVGRAVGKEAVTLEREAVSELEELFD